MAISNSLSGFLHLPLFSFLTLYNRTPNCQSLSSLETDSFYFHEIAFAFWVVVALSSPTEFFFFFFFSESLHQNPAGITEKTATRSSIPSSPAPPLHQLVQALSRLTTPSNKM